MVQCHSLGGIKPNTVLLGWSDQREKKETFINILQAVKRLKKNIIILDEEENLSKENKPGVFELKDMKIDVWWRGEREMEA